MGFRAQRHRWCCSFEYTLKWTIGHALSKFSLRPGAQEDWLASCMYNYNNFVRNILFAIDYSYGVGYTVTRASNLMVHVQEAYLSNVQTFSSSNNDKDVSGSMTLFLIL